MVKIYIVSENITLENNQTWIIDIFANEFTKYSSLNFTQDIEEADLVWIVGYDLDKVKFIKQMVHRPKVVTTIHHIDIQHTDTILEFIREVEPITTRYHVICDKVERDLRRYTSKPIVKANFWINEDCFYPIEDKESIRTKWNLPMNRYVIGSFQRDTNGKSKCMVPKLSKGPDILVNILKKIKQSNPNLLVLLTGRRRNYIINELTQEGIEYVYHEMVSAQELNVLYNCLDLYVVSSRVEGGPRAIMECGLTKTPIISTDVGIASLILPTKSIYDMNNYKTYRDAVPDTEHAYEESRKYTIQKHMEFFIQIVFGDYL